MGVRGQWLGGETKRGGKVRGGFACGHVRPGPEEGFQVVYGSRSYEEVSRWRDLRLEG